MFIKDNKLYYINTDDEDALWYYDLKSGENKRIISASIEILQNIDNTVFYKIDKEMGVYLYNFTHSNDQQLSLVQEVSHDRRLTQALDEINHRYGTSAIHSAHSSAGAARIRQKVPFGSTNYLDLLID